MSLDDGSPDGFNVAQIQARIKSEYERNFESWGEFLRAANVRQEDLLRALELGANGLPSTLPLFQRLSVALGHDADWVAFGIESNPSRIANLVSRVKKLVWEYIYTQNISDLGTRNSLLNAALAPITAPNFSECRYRRPIVRTLKDVLRLHKELLKSAPHLD